jgi:hypothetical protein
MWSSETVKQIECDWPLGGLKRLSTVLLTEASVPFNQMANLEILKLELIDFGMLSGIGCLSKLNELTVDHDLTGKFKFEGP